MPTVRAWHLPSVRLLWKHPHRYTQRCVSQGSPNSVQFPWRTKQSVSNESWLKRQNLFESCSSLCSSSSAHASQRSVLLLYNMYLLIACFFLCLCGVQACVYMCLHVYMCAHTCMYVEGSGLMSDVVSLQVLGSSQGPSSYGSPGAGGLA